MKIPNPFADRTRGYSVKGNLHESDATHIRWLIRRDMPEVLQIERTSFDAPWCQEVFDEQLRRRRVIGMVAEQKDRVVGYVLYEIHREHIEIINLAVSTESRRQGIGGELVSKVLGKLRPYRDLIIVRVLDRNLPGQLLFRHRGFRCNRIETQFFSDDSDAYVFRYRKDFNSEISINTRH